MHLLLAACETSSEFVEQAQQLPQNCEQLAEPVALPVFKDSADFRVIAGQHRRGMIQANENLTATRNCQRTVRDSFTGR